ncbi:MAG: hypothetical protein FWF38_03770 [Spirochaetaceae bacterium]|nr:hypothetical protein [Spirochaetaceae bacterium]
MKLKADIFNGILAIDELTWFQISNRVRTLKDGTRSKTQVIYSIPDHLPYDPQPFPKGTWNIYAVEWQKDKNFDYKEYGPVKIRTDAHCMVNVWELDEDGDYLRETDKQVRDQGYLLHWSSFQTTLGCIKIENNAEILGEIIQGALDKGEKVQIEVI